MKPGDYLTTSSTKPGYAMKATQAGYVIGKALESSALCHPVLGTGSSAGSLDSGSGAGMTQSGITQGMVDDITNLNLTDASVFGKLVVTDTLYIQKDLHVKGITYLAELRVDKIQAKEITTQKLCVDDICVTRDQFKAMFDKTFGGQTQGTVNGTSTTTPSNGSNTTLNQSPAAGSGSGQADATNDTPPASLEEPTLPTPPPTPDIVPTPTPEASPISTPTPAPEDSVPLN